MILPTLQGKDFLEFLLIRLEFLLQESMALLLTVALLVFTVMGEYGISMPSAEDMEISHLSVGNRHACSLREADFS